MFHAGYPQNPGSGGAPPTLRNTFRKIRDRFRKRRRTQDQTNPADDAQSDTSETSRITTASQSTEALKDKQEPGPVLVEFKTNISLDVELDEELMAISERKPLSTLKDKLIDQLVMGLKKLYKRNELHFLISVEETSLYFKGASKYPSYLMTVQPTDELDQPIVGDLVRVLQERIRVCLAIQPDRGLIRILPCTSVGPYQWILFDSSDESRKSESSAGRNGTHAPKSGPKDSKVSGNGSNTSPPDSKQKPVTAPQQDRPNNDQQSKTSHEGAADKEHPDPSTA